MADLSSRPADHLMIQFGADSWVGAPDSVKTSGSGRHFNIYFMLDKPFRTNNKFSLAYGVGFGTNNQYIDKRHLCRSCASWLIPFVSDN